MAESALCEVRVPTYKRPDSLRRALRSLLKQSHQHWIARIFDDSPEQEAKAVVAEFNDPRIRYEPNAENLGASKNIDKCFAAVDKPADYAFMLEDDNWIFPTFIEENIRAAQQHNVGIVLRNQEIWYEHQGETRNTGRTMRGQTFKEGIVPARHFHMSPMLFEGISNGGLFWSNQMQSDLQVGPTVRFSGLQERCRSFQIDEPVYFASQPLAVWTHLEEEEMFREMAHGRVVSRGKQSMVNMVYRHFGKEAIAYNQPIAERSNTAQELEHVLLEAGHFSYRSGKYDIRNRIIISMKGLYKRLFIADPIRDYWETKKAVFLRPSL
jgi:glycosyltransferase involved in cell wall biosynthesis